MSGESKRVVEIGGVRLWIEQETVHIKAVTQEGDPVELSEDEATLLASALTKLVKEIDEDAE